MSPEVLIYIQNIKHYFTTNSEAKKYFDVKGNEDLFFEYITELSQKNFEENGEPQLTLDQFEELRKKIRGHRDEAIGLFMSIGDYGLVSLN